MGGKKLDFAERDNCKPVFLTLIGWKSEKPMGPNEGSIAMDSGSSQTIKCFMPPITQTELPYFFIYNYFKFYVVNKKELKRLKSRQLICIQFLLRNIYIAFLNDIPGHM
jgi:hypothetical protein